MRKKITQTVHRLRAQPIKTRKAILVGVSFGVTGLIILIWLVSFAFTRKNDKPNPPPENNAESPFTIIKDSVVEVYDGNSNKPLEKTGN